MEKKVFKDSNNKPINQHLDNLESIQDRVTEIIREKETVIKNIRNGFIEVVVIFIDLVGSTKYKIDTKDEPEKWILRIKQFGEIIKEYIENSNGKVVKYIGDEVMGIFDKATQIDDALSLILRINNIEENLTNITGTDTKVKIALDYGDVFLIKYEGHDEPDPQGTPIDRCARIGKHCQESTILSSYEFVLKCSFPKHWHKLGKVKMKGLEEQFIYQYGEETIEAKNMVEIAEDDLVNLKETNSSQKEEIQNYNLEKNEYISTINELQEQIKNLGENPIIETDFNENTEKENMEKDWAEIERYFASIKKLIKDSGIYETEYARFLFLHRKGIDEEYNSFKGKEFDSVIEKDLVVQNDHERFELNTEHKRNIKINNLINKTETLLNNYERDYGTIDDEDLFEHSFSDADFWDNYLNINVSNF